MNNYCIASKFHACTYNQFLLTIPFFRGRRRGHAADSIVVIRPRRGDLSERQVMRWPPRGLLTISPPPPPGSLTPRRCRPHCPAPRPRLPPSRSSTPSSPASSRSPAAASRPRRPRSVYSVSFHFAPGVACTASRVLLIRARVANS
jgi:hypothetical protein